MEKIICNTDDILTTTQEVLIVPSCSNDYSYNIDDDDENDNIQLLDIPEISSGVTRNQRGFIFLLLKATANPIIQLIYNQLINDTKFQ